MQMVLLSPALARSRFSSDSLTNWGLKALPILVNVSKLLSCFRTQLYTLPPILPNTRVKFLTYLSVRCSHFLYSSREKENNNSSDRVLLIATKCLPLGSLIQREDTWLTLGSHSAVTYLVSERKMLKQGPNIQGVLRTRMGLSDQLAGD